MSITIPATPKLAEAPKLQPHELEMERKKALLAKVKTIRERLAANRGMVDGMKPNKVYVWVNINDNRQIHFQGLGYEVCRDQEVKSHWKQEDGTHKRGDLILYECDKDLHEAIEYDSQIRAVESIEGAKQEFKETAARAGVPTFIPGQR